MGMSRLFLFWRWALPFMEAVRTSIFVPLHYLGYWVEKGVSADGTIVVIWAASIGACHDNSRVYSKIVLLSLKMAVN